MYSKTYSKILPQSLITNREKPNIICYSLKLTYLKNTLH